MGVGHPGQWTPGVVMGWDAGVGRREVVHAGAASHTTTRCMVMSHCTVEVLTRPFSLPPPGAPFRRDVCHTPQRSHRLPAPPACGHAASPAASHLAKLAPRGRGRLVHDVVERKTVGWGYKGVI